MSPFYISIEITKNGVIFQDSILHIKVSYFAFGIKNYLVDLAIVKHELDHTKTLISSFETYLLSSNSNRVKTLSFPSIPDNYTTDLIHVNVPANPVNNYYIEYPNGLQQIPYILLPIFKTRSRL